MDADTKPARPVVAQSAEAREQAIAAQLLADCYRLLNDARRFKTRDGKLDSYAVAARLASFINE